MLIDLRAEHAVAVRAGVSLVAQVTDSHLTRRSPCAGWTLAELLAHMTAQDIGFAAAATGRGADPQVWAPHPFAGPASFADTAEQVITNFAAVDLQDCEVRLPEIHPSRGFPAATAIGFHFVDYVAHGWDLAQTLGLPFTLPDKVLEAALPVAEAVPDGLNRLAVGAAFAPALPTPQAADLLTRILRRLGRAA